MSSLEPLGDWLLVKLPKKDTEEKTTDFGLILTLDSDFNEGLLKAEVVSVGKGGTDINGARLPIDVEVGDSVYYAPGNGLTHKINGEEHLFLNYRAGYVLAVEKAETL